MVLREQFLDVRLSHLVRDNRATEFSVFPFVIRNTRLCIPLDSPHFELYHTRQTPYTALEIGVAHNANGWFGPLGV